MIEVNRDKYTFRLYYIFTNKEGDLKLIKVNNQARGSGKTSIAIQMMREDENAICLVPNKDIKISFPKEIRRRVVVGDSTHLKEEVIYRRYSKLIVDELLYPKSFIAELFYELGRKQIAVVVYGTD